MTPGQRLARNRRAIIDALDGRDRHPAHGAPGPAATDPATARAPRKRRTGWWSLGQDVLGAWWEHHPAHLAVDVARPVLGSYARTSPWRVIGIAALAGAVLVLLRPWRAITLSTLVFAGLRSSQLHRMLFSLLSAANRRFPR
jgi:hypothetical protein